MKIIYPFTNSLTFGTSDIEHWLIRTDKKTNQEYVGKHSHLIQNKRIFYVLQFNSLHNTQTEQQFKIGVAMSPLGRFKMYYNQAGTNGKGNQGVKVKMILGTSRTASDKNIEYTKHQVVRLEDSIKKTMKEKNKILRGSEWLLCSPKLLLNTIKLNLSRVNQEGRIYNVRDFNLRPQNRY